MCYIKFLQNYKMPEVRTATRPALADISGGGFFITRVASPGAVLMKGTAKLLARHSQTASSNKENVPPMGFLRTTPKRRSPLPDWYPRTPLRDITSIVKVMQCSLNSVRAVTISSSLVLLYLMHELYYRICHSPQCSNVIVSHRIRNAWLSVTKVG